MLTGRRAFDGEDMTEVLGAVVRLEPNWQALPADVPLPIRTLLQGCLVKDRGRRVADISTALFVLDKAASLAAPAAAVAAEPVSRPALWRRVAAPVTAALVAAAVVGTGVWYATRAGSTAIVTGLAAAHCDDRGGRVEPRREQLPGDRARWVPHRLRG